MSEDFDGYKAKALAHTAALETNQQALLQRIATLEAAKTKLAMELANSALREADLQTQVNVLTKKLESALDRLDRDPPRDW